MQGRPRSKYPDLYYRVRNKKVIDLVAGAIEISISLQEEAFAGIFSSADLELLAKELERIQQIQQVHQEYKENKELLKSKSGKSSIYARVSEEEHFKTINNNRRQRIAARNANSFAYRRPSRTDTPDDHYSNK